MRERKALEDIEAELDELKQQGWTTDRLLVAVLGRQEDLMATLQEVVDAVDQDKAAVEAAAARVGTDLQALSQQVADLQAQLAAGAGVTAEQLDTLKSGIDGVTGEASAIDAAPPQG